MKLLEIKRLQQFLHRSSYEKLVYNNEVGNYDRNKQEGGLMNIIIPIKADNSTSSRSRLMRGYASVKTSRANRKRYISSMITGTFLVSALLIGSVGGNLHNAAASDTFPASPLMFNPNQSNTPERIQPVAANVLPVVTAPAVPVTPMTITAPAVPVTTSVPATSTLPVVPPTTVPPSLPPASALPPASTPSTAPTFAPAIMSPTQSPQSMTNHSTNSATNPTIAATPTNTRSQPLIVQDAVAPQLIERQIAAQPFDTASEIANLTSAEARNNPQSVIYSSGRLSSQTRDRLLILAAIALIVSVLLYRMSMISSAAAARRQLVPVTVQDGDSR
jgi:hypothetical protein